LTAYVAVWSSGVAVKWRALRWAEHRKYAERYERSVPMSVFNDIYRVVVLEGPDISDVTAGIVQFIGNSVLNWSAFANDFPTVKTKLDECRQEIVGDYLMSAKAVVASLFRYTLDEIDQWDSDTLFKHIAMAEVVSGRRMEPEGPNAPRPSSKQNPNQLNKDEAPKLKPQPNSAQKLVIDRVRKSRGA
jgi:hypothetical protein